MFLNSRCWLSLATVIGLVVSQSGCIERSVVVKVKKDGSGVVHLRSHTQQATITFGGNASKSEVEIPTEERLGKLAEKMGAGVQLVSLTESTNRSGWSGYDAIWKFDDINQLTLPGEVLGSDDSDEAEAERADDSDDSGDDADEKDSEENEDGGFRFAYKDGVLSIHPYGHGLDGETEEAAKRPQGAVDPFAAEPASQTPSINLTDAVTEQLFAKVLADMRLGIFVEVDGQVSDSNAKHRKENLVTLMSIHVGKLLDNPAAKQKLKELGNKKANMAKFQELADKVDGIDIDMQDPIRIAFQ